MFCSSHRSVLRAENKEVKALRSTTSILHIKQLLNRALARNSQKEISVSERFSSKKYVEDGRQPEKKKYDSDNLVPRGPASEEGYDNQS